MNEQPSSPSGAAAPTAAAGASASDAATKATAASAAATRRPLTAALRLLRPAALVLLTLALLLTALAGSAVWLLRDEAGTRWLLARLPFVQASGVRGALLSTHFQADRLRVQWAGGRQSATLLALDAAGLRWTWRPAPGVWFGLDAERLSLAVLSVDTGPPSDQPRVLPASLQLPLRVAVRDLRIDALRVGQAAPARVVGASVELGGAGGHRVDRLQLEWDRLRLQGDAAIASTPPFALRAQLQAAPLASAGPAFAPYTATLQAGGTLERTTLAAALRGSERAGHGAPQADVQAVLQPFAAWPLAALAASTDALDLAALFSAAPETRLSGRIDVQSQSLAAPVRATVALDNALAGRWNEGRLPVRRLLLNLQGSAAQRDTLRLDALDVTFGAAAPRATAAPAAAAPAAPPGSVRPAPPQPSRRAGTPAAVGNTAGTAGTAGVAGVAGVAGTAGTAGTARSSTTAGASGATPGAAAGTARSSRAVGAMTGAAAPTGTADAAGGAGHWRASGEWRGGELHLDSVLDAVRPQQLDGRAPAMTLSGPLTIALHGLPSPAGAPAAQTAPAAAPRQATPSAAATAPAAATGPAAAAAPATATRASTPRTALPAAAPAPLSVDLQGRLEGRLAAPQQSVRLVIDASADANRVDIRQLRAEAGAAVAQATGSARRGAAGAAWQLLSTGSLTGFDPQPWWPGEASAAWRPGLTSVSGDWQFDVSVPRAATGVAPLALLQRLSGNGRLQLRDTRIAGLPLSADIALKQATDAQAAADATPSSLHGELQLAGNGIVVDARGNPAGSGAADRWQIDVAAPALAALGPLLRAFPSLAAWAPSAGSASASVSAQGRWPALRSQGRVQLQQLQAGPLGVAAAVADWKVDTADGSGQPVELHADLRGARYGTQRADSLRAELRGTVRDHTLFVSAALPLAAPPAAEQLLAMPAQAGTRALLQAEGGWLANAAGGGRWRAHVSRLAVGSGDGSAAAAADSTAAPPAQWVDASDLNAELQFAAGGRLQRLQAAAGKARLAGTAVLRWDEIVVDLPPQSADAAATATATATPPPPVANLQLKADIEPFAVAPLLARLQPTMGWSGDLRLQAQLAVRAGTDRFDADVTLERRDGDLRISDERAGQSLGLTQLRLALAAHDGAWLFTQQLAGRTLGQIDGSVRAKTPPRQRWPGADAPLDGTVDARVADLAVWSAWVPAGWRLAGEVHTSAAIGGRFGAPEYTGAVRGSGIGARNLLEGVNIADGTVAITLQGTTAQIETFRFRGGDGTLSASGGATFGSQPSARLHLVADRFRLLGRIDRQLITSGSADLLLQADLLKLDGSLRVDEGLIDATRGNAPSLDDDVTVRLAGSAGRPADDAAAAAAAIAAQRPRRNVQVALAVDLGERLRVRGRGLDTGLSGQLRVSTPGGRLAVQGTVNAERGTYQAYGQKLAIDRGIVAFSGAVNNPRLDILALRPNTDTRVGVAISGNVLTPRVRLYSETDMSDTDRLSWLVLGRAPDSLGRTDTALLQRAAVALLAGEGESPSDAFMRNLGIDELSLRQSDGEVRETVISLGKQISQRWYVGYERGVNATSGTFQLIYRIAQRFTLRAQSGLENSLDVIWVWRRDEAPPPPPMPKSAAANRDPPP